MVEARDTVVATAINVLAYLAEHPEAGDTVEGVIEWWVESKGGTRVTREMAREALTLLVTAGLVTTVQSADSRSHYRLNPACYRQVRALLDELDRTKT